MRISNGSAPRIKIILKSFKERAGRAIRFRILKTGRARYNKFFDEKKTIFIHIPKTGGLSIASSLFSTDFRAGHSKAIEYRRLNKNKFNSYFKFGIVRNPWDRFLSAYTFLKKGGLTPVDRKWAEEHIFDIENFEDFVCKLIDQKFQEKVLSWKHFEPQYRYLCDKNLNIIVDYVGRFEDLESSYLNVKMKINVDKNLKKINTSRSKLKSYKEFYKNDQMKEIVSRLYERDILLFNYEFDGDKL